MITDNITVIGNDHVFKNIECQDSSDSWKGDGYCAVIVCDGHGGAKYIRSKKGSETACKAGRGAIEEFMEGLRKETPPVKGDSPFHLNKESSEKQLVQLERAIILRWNEAVRAHLDENPIEEDPRFEALSDAHKKSLKRTAERAYGTTFIAAVLTDHFCFAFKLGDGNVAMLSNEGGFFPEEFPYNPWDFNGTYSMCDSDADAVFTHCFYENSDSFRIDGVTVMSDGAVNSFSSMESYVKFISNVFDGYREDEFSVAHEELTDALCSFTKNGSGDDISIGIIIKPETAARYEAQKSEEESSRENTGGAFDRLGKAAEMPLEDEEMFSKGNNLEINVSCHDREKTVEEKLKEYKADIADDKKRLDVLNALLEHVDTKLNPFENDHWLKNCYYEKQESGCENEKGDKAEKITISARLWRYIETNFEKPYRFLKGFKIENTSSGDKTYEKIDADGQSSDEDGER